MTFTASVLMRRRARARRAHVESRQHGVTKRRVFF